tara:strand:+ start:417 stop:656 length:240 start_codon:yes stop_codon:yes gene_type:complete
MESNNTIPDIISSEDVSITELVECIRLLYNSNQRQKKEFDYNLNLLNSEIQRHKVRISNLETAHKELSLRLVWVEQETL